MPNVPALPPQPIPPDLVKEMAMDIGKEVAAYIERQYPEAVAATSSTFLLSLRNTVYNQIVAALETTDANEIAERLGDRDEDMIAIPRWMLAILAGELAAASGCGGEYADPDCPVCKSIRTAKWASECGITRQE